MKTTWLNRNNNTSLILFFSGFGFTEKALEHLSFDTVDVLFVNDYNTDTVNLPLSTFTNYENIHLVGWSMGVPYAAKWLSENSIKIDKSIAICGSLTPFDNIKGIPKRLFKRTADRWNEDNRTAFNKNVFGKFVNEELLQLGRVRTLENQQAELHYLLTLFDDIKLGNPFKIVLIGTEDLIFTKNNLEAAWQDNADIQFLETGHFPFSHFNSWEDILAYAL